MVRETTIGTSRPRSQASRVLAFVAKRLLTAIMVLLVVTVLVFAFIHAAPGGPEQAIAGPDADPAQLAAIRATYGLDDPLPQQYLRFLGSLAHFDLGTSYSLHESVISAIWRAATVVTIPLLLISWFLSTTIGSLLGYFAARSRGGVLDRTIVGFAILGASSPIFATGMLISYIFGVKLGWFPFIGVGGDESLRQLVLPGAAATVLLLASSTKLARVRFAQILDEDQVTFARARGLSPQYIAGKAILKNSAVHLVTWSGSLFVALLGGLVVVEQVFSLSGVGTLLINAISARDIPLIQGITLAIAIGVVLVNLAVDLICLAIDPRVRLGLEVEA
ncbi:peptide/nickel transport system permease protein/glutathione transport system permease protein [Antricoccus suffuscus]|uniref:Peptide/nickel transport system permease protein/glutathione transport system permease protein n=1 Tax=Antricoccus suffuscus TaxID=1629062 RepID=A0A2T0ZTS1_9ACTN|nr:ABC transporter permease [Antricoccus suffuscus]PRZ39684.1 peptide/nickel transport system permease protein/glutathione transport system permease protein [Antricoccus suffuscus]